jgi:3-phenylpropionate/trans-cinnamate dioxygenase alpha subunit
VNWKFPADNFGSDGYHVPISHASAIALGYGGQGRGQSVVRSEFVTNSNKAINDYYRDHLPEMKQRLGENKVTGVSGSIYTIFPNLSFNFGRQLLHVWHPRGPMKTEIWGYCIVDQAAPPEMKKFMSHWYSHTFGPSGNLEQDDMNNWMGGTETSRTGVARRYPMNLQMGIGHEHERMERFGGGMGRNVEGQGQSQGYSYTESRQRGLYAQWAEMMDGATWSDIRIIPKNHPIF